MTERSKTMLSQRSSASGTAMPIGRSRDRQGNATENGEHFPWNINISRPQPHTDMLTMKQARTPGWNQPWSPRQPRESDSSEDIEDAHLESGRGDPWEGRTAWYRRRKRLRAFILNNNYVPLVSGVVRACSESLSLNWQSLTAVPCRQYHLYDRCIDCRGSYSKDGESVWYHGCNW
jgi:hypothetical protein